MNFFELICKLDNMRIYLTSEDMCLPTLKRKLQSVEKDMNEILWTGYNIRYGDYCIIVLDKFNRIIASISESDVIQIDQKKIKITSINEIGDEAHDYDVVVQDVDTQAETTYNGIEFMKLFELDTTTYIYNSSRTRMLNA